jgi:hypothetical protein
MLGLDGAERIDQPSSYLHSSHGYGVHVGMGQQDREYWSISRFKAGG